MHLSIVTAAILAGGLGTRLRSKVSDRPKVLAQVGSRPFLAYLLDQLVALGCRTVILCTGYLGENISRAFGEFYGPLRLVYSQEQAPMGTGGALRLALPNIESDPVLVMNGDSYCDLDLHAFRSWHSQQEAAASIALVRVLDGERYGRVELNANARIAEFVEKEKGAGPGWINAGVYLLSQEIIRSISASANSSLEKDVFPAWVDRGLSGYMSLGRFIDIGTPEDFAAAQDFFSGIRQRRFVVLDRDGTIIEERYYLSQPEQVRLLPGAGAALRDLRRMGFGLVVVTNQSGIGRGLFDHDGLERIHARLEELLEREGVRLDGIYHCPHIPDDHCDCRKPRRGLMEKAAQDLSFDPQDSIVIGDKACDIEMGRMVGALTFLVRTGYGPEFEGRVEADFVVDDLPAAMHLISSLVETQRTSTDGN